MSMLCLYIPNRKKFSKEKTVIFRQKVDPRNFFKNQKSKIADLTFIE